jgi:tRNA-dihydrouridine synthase B
MIGRAAQGRPWIFREIVHYLQTGQHLSPPTWQEMHGLLLAHLEDHYAFYGESVGVKCARKHIGWYVARLPGGRALTDQINTAQSTAEQFRWVDQWFKQQCAAFSSEACVEKLAA